MPAGWVPPPDWDPDPAWGLAPEGWNYWLHDPLADDEKRVSPLASTSQESEAKSRIPVDEPKRRPKHPYNRLQRKRRRRTIALVTGVCVALATTVAVVAVSEKSGVGEPGPVSSAVSATTAQAAGLDSERESVSSVVPVGQPGKVGNWTVAVEPYTGDAANFVKELDPAAPSLGKTRLFLVVQVKATNNAATPLRVSALESSLLAPVGLNNYPGYRYCGNLMSMDHFTQTVSPGETVEYWACSIATRYEAPVSLWEISDTETNQQTKFARR